MPITHEIEECTDIVKVLLFEDTLWDVQLLRKSLERAGLKIELTHIDSIAGLQNRLQDETFDILITDYHLPGTSIYQVLNETMDRDATLPAIVVSGVAVDDDVVDLLRQGVRDFVSKDNLPRLAPAVIREVNDVA